MPPERFWGRMPEHVFDVLCSAEAVANRTWKVKGVGASPRLESKVASPPPSLQSTLTPARASTSNVAEKSRLIKFYATPYDFRIPLKPFGKWMAAMASAMRVSMVPAG